MDVDGDDGECSRIRAELDLLARLISENPDLGEARDHWQARAAQLEARLAARCRCGGAA